MRRKACIILNMKYKLVVSDYDGTLCRSDNTVSARSKEVIDEYFRRGGIFTLSSGRNVLSLRKQLKSAGLDSRDIPILGLQGSVIEDNLTGRLLHETVLPKDRLMWFVGECLRRGLYYHVYTRDRIYSSVSNDYSDFYTRMTGVGMEFVGGIQKFLLECGRDDFIKVFAVAENGMNVTLAKELGKLAPSGVKIFTSGSFFFECISADAGKGNGLKKAADLLGIDMSETMAFGDEMNDESALKAAALGVAMDNARPELKAVADIIAPKNDLDGVAATIEKYCL